MMPSATGQLRHRLCDACRVLSGTFPCCSNTIKSNSQVNMGYSGGGPTPLCGVKRLTRAGLQEDEARHRRSSRGFARDGVQVFIFGFAQHVDSI